MTALSWFIFKPVASVLTPNLGIVDEWKTTVAVIIIRINVFTGRAVRFCYLLPEVGSKFKYLHDTYGQV